MSATVANTKESNLSKEHINLDDDVKMNRTKEKLKLAGMRLALLVTILVIWELVSGSIVDKFWISEPSDIFQTLYTWVLAGELFFHIGITTQEMVIGFIIGASAGAILGFILGRWEFGAKLLDPFIMALYSLPKVALAPLFILWFGIGIEMKIVFAAVIVFYLVFFNTYAGVKNVDSDLIDSIRLMGATERQILMKVTIPSALNWVFVGFKMSVPYALIGAVVGEITASNRGVGYLISYSAGQFDTAGTFAAVLILMVMGVTVNFIIGAAEKHFLRWKITNN
ncbi:ABC transporter permease [Schinkia azotoformans]|uniref:Binding-protein-dependent transport system inner membrane protein n=1 Tax=Schinkia azotoformans LMG 9581 TaxID=1131731 RepID=K6CJ47_SCHAZ|nr:ABC transporter permease [Schinkia azotoformans]EKN71170.1 binding-protein-dependent transport system inner membrane protein [Schinkia azotoformans LMG 9581]MEC1638883.1 ABC transporter permease [Schinkia azotoformans]MEC1720909.1 ABC transporter permease [Schinkia azotoformans]MEC1946848.1 ABC transporter permease [Schinkia azotoformans]MED4353139.1 ABC transporter permease [Schinkia azotoformans]